MQLQLYAVQQAIRSVQQDVGVSVKKLLLLSDTIPIRTLYAAGCCAMLVVLTLQAVSAAKARGAPCFKRSCTASKCPI